MDIDEVVDPVDAPAERVFPDMGLGEKAFLLESEDHSVDKEVGY